MAYEEKPNQTNCFKKDGFEGYSGLIKTDDGKEYWVTIYDNEGKKGPYRGVKLKPKQASNKTESNPSYGEGKATRRVVDDMDSDIPFMRMA